MFTQDTANAFTRFIGNIIAHASTSAEGVRTTLRMIDKYHAKDFEQAQPDLFKQLKATGERVIQALDHEFSPGGNRNPGTENSLTGQFMKEFSNLCEKTVSSTKESAPLPPSDLPPSEDTPSSHGPFM